MDTKEAIQINVLLCLFFLTHFPKNKVYSFFGQKCYRYFDLYLNINNQVLEKKSWFKANKIHVLLLIILLKGCLQVQVFPDLFRESCESNLIFYLKAPTAKSPQILYLNMKISLYFIFILEKIYYLSY